MAKIMEKVLLSKVIIECLMDARDREEELGYEDMMAIVEGTIVPDGCPPLTEESLINHAQFVVAQVCLSMPLCFFCPHPTSALFCRPLEKGCCFIGLEF